MLNTVIMTSITNAKCSFSGNPSLKPSLIDHAKELPTITGAMALCVIKKEQKKLPMGSQLLDSTLDLVN